MKQEFRCGACKALLLKAEDGAIAGLVEIKCRRCGTFNHLSPPRPHQTGSRPAQGE